MVKKIGLIFCGLTFFVFLYSFKPLFADCPYDYPCGGYCDYYWWDYSCGGANSCGGGCDSCTAATDVPPNACCWLNCNWVDTWCSGSTPCPATTTTVCTAGTNCYCVGRRRYCDTDADQTCANTCNGSACDMCPTPSCLTSPQVIDADNDGWDPAPCGDCNDSNTTEGRNTFPGNSNVFCDCNYSDPVLHPSGSGISELTNCELAPGELRFKLGCLCKDNKDNDCDGLVDDYDPDCPDLSPGADWYIEEDTTIRRNITRNGGVWVVNGATLTIPSPFWLDIAKASGLHVDATSKVDVQPGGKIKFH